tara:strand:+ start:543 stop:1457 length:915 start_codon:yes stop_codon:yes gene_type:complete
MTDFNSLTGIDKAAILFSVLGEPLALTLFKDLDEDQIIKIRLRSKELGIIDPLLRKEVLEEYYFKIVSDKYENQTTESKDMFDFLKALSDEQIFYLLSKEKPKIAALAMEQLKDSQKGIFLNKLDTETKKEVVREIGNLGDIPLEAVLNVAKELEKKVAFIPETKEFSRGGGQSMAKILGEMTEDDAKLYLEQIEQEDSKLYEEIRKYFYTFDDLLGLPKEKMRELFNAVEVDDIPLAFKGQEDKLNQVIETLPPKKQKMVEPLTAPRPKKDVDNARKKVLDLAKQMEKEGKITIEDLVGGEMI